MRRSSSTSASIRSDDAPHRPRRLIAVGLTGLIAASGLLVPHLFHAHALIGHLRGTPYVKGFDSLDDPWEVLFALADGQSYVVLARDPTLSNLDAFRGARGQAALRADRPLQAYLGWFASLGDPNHAEAGVVIATLLGAGLAAAGCGELLRRRGRSPWWGLCVLVLPGAVAGLRAFGPELLGLGLACFGIVAAEENRPWPAVTLFVLAGLARETYLLIPLVYVLRDRRYIIPPAVWVGWTGIVWWRFSAWGPNVSLDGTHLLTMPFFGFVRALPHVQSPVATIICMVMIPLLVVAVLDRKRGDPLVPMIAAYAVFAILLDWVTWVFWASFTRPLLPLFAFALIALAAPLDVAARPLRLPHARKRPFASKGRSPRASEDTAIATSPYIGSEYPKI